MSPITNIESSNAPNALTEELNAMLGSWQTNPDFIPFFDLKLSAIGNFMHRAFESTIGFLHTTGKWTDACKALSIDPERIAKKSKLDKQIPALELMTYFIDKKYKVGVVARALDGIIDFDFASEVYKWHICINRIVVPKQSMQIKTRLDKLCFEPSQHDNLCIASVIKRIGKRWPEVFRNLWIEPIMISHIKALDPESVDTKTKAAITYITFLAKQKKVIGEFVKALVDANLQDIALDFITVAKHQLPDQVSNRTVDGVFANQLKLKSRIGSSDASLPSYSDERLPAYSNGIFGQGHGYSRIESVEC